MRWIREHIGGVTLTGLVLATAAFIVFAWFHQPPVTYDAPTFAATSESSTPTATVPNVTFIGDSYVDGSAMNSSPATLFRNLLATQLHLNVTSEAVGGVGYVAENPAFPNSTYPTQATKVPANSDLVVIFGSRNDPGQDSATITAAVEQTIANVRATASNASILVIGPVYTAAKPPAPYLAARDAVEAGTTATGVSFIDPLGEGWFAEGNTALIGSDGVHPTDAGHAYLAEKIAPLIETMLAAR